MNNLKNITVGDVGKAVGEVGLQAATGLGSTIAGGLAGVNQMAYEGLKPLVGGTPDWNKPAEAVRAVQDAGTYEPRSAAGQKTADFLSKVYEPYDKGVDWLAEKSAPEGGSPLGSAMVYTAGSMLPAAVGIRSKGAPKGPKPKTAKAPTTAELKKQASQAYKAADDAGVIVSKESFGGFVDRLQKRMADEGIDATLHPKSLAALKRLMDDADKNLSLKGAVTLRRVVQDAAKTMDPADGRIAGMMRREIDNYIENLGAKDVLGDGAKGAAAGKALKDARDMWSRARKSEVVEELVERAGVTAGQFTGSGFENALRTEFRALAKNKRRLRGFTKEEQAAIRKVATGGTIDNMARYIGKFAPRGVVSMSAGTGLGYMAFGPAGPMAVMGAGELGRMAATKLTKRNVERASELIRRGPNDGR